MSLENIAGEGENPDYQYFLLSPKCFVPSQNFNVQAIFYLPLASAQTLV